MRVLQTGCELLRGVLPLGVLTPSPGPLSLPRRHIGLAGRGGAVIDGVVAAVGGEHVDGQPKRNDFLTNGTFHRLMASRDTTPEAVLVATADAELTRLAS